MYSNAQKKDKLETRKNMRNHIYIYISHPGDTFLSFWWLLYILYVTIITNNIMALEVYLLNKQRSQQCKEPSVDPKLNGP